MIDIEYAALLVSYLVLVVPVVLVSCCAMPAVASEFLDTDRSRISISLSSLVSSLFSNYVLLFLHSL